MSENHGLLKRFGTAEVLGRVSFTMSFEMEVSKDRDHQHLKWQVGADKCCRDAGIDPSLPSPASIFEPFVLQQDGKVVTATRVGANIPGEVEKKRWTAKG